MIADNKYLYDQLESLTRQKIEEFYQRLDEFNRILGQVYKITTKIINDELRKVVPTLGDWIVSHSQEDLVEITLSLRDVSGNITPVVGGFNLRNALVRRKSLRRYLQSFFPFDEIISITSKIRNANYSMSEAELKKLWKGCKAQAKQNKSYLLVWEKRSELLELCKNILKEMRSH